MAIGARATFMNALEEQVADELTKAKADEILTVIADILDGYDLTQHPWDGQGDEPDDYLTAYLSALKVMGRSPKTIERYKYVIEKIMKRANVPTRKVTVYHLRKYLADEKQDGRADQTLEGERQVLSAYFNWLQREGLLTQNPTANLGSIKVPKRQKQAYSEIDIEKLKNSCDNARDKAMVCFLLSTGCRVSEMLSLIHI